MSILIAIEAFNKETQPGIAVITTRDGRVTAKLPRVGREIVVHDSSFNPDIKSTPADIAWLCEEARRAMEPGMALLSEGLDALHKLKA
jgi:hypothetical protein